MGWSLRHRTWSQVSDNEGESGLPLAWAMMADSTGIDQRSFGYVPTSKVRLAKVCDWTDARDVKSSPILPPESIVVSTIESVVETRDAPCPRAACAS